MDQSLEPEERHDESMYDAQDSSAEFDSELALILADLVDKLQQGDAVSLSRIMQEHPRFAGEIQEMWGTIVVAQVSGKGLPQATLSSSNGFAEFQLPATLGDYKLLEVIGRGGMGVVYRAHQESLNRPVAVKMIQESKLLSPETRKRFFAEAEATARLDFPAIVPIYEVSEYEGRPYFSMQYIRGETLSDRLRQGPLPQRLAARIMADVCRAIGYAHANGILHRDVKPSNIMIDSSDQIKVTDFGLAKLSDASDELTRSGSILGTPSYMSPEQAAGRTETVNAQSDVYSLGAVLYHLLTGRPPFIADSPIHLAMQILEHEPPAVRLIDPSIDRDLELIVARSIQKPADLRYPSADAMADDLEAYLRDEPVAARRGTLAEVATRLFRETHHATILDNWGVLWMWHSLVLLVVCLTTEVMAWSGVVNRLSYAGVWTFGLGAWAIVFWALRRRMGPVTFVERQIAHVWGASLLAIIALTPLEWLLKLPPLQLSPVLAIIGAMLFFVKAGILTGTFYIQAAVLLITSFIMALLPTIAHTIFGFVSAACFFVPGYKYYRRSLAE